MIQDLSSEGLDSLSDEFGTVDSSNAFRCGSPRLKGDSSGGVYLDLVRLASSIAARKRVADSGASLDQVSREILRNAGPVNDTLIRRIYQDRMRDANREYGRFETMQIVDDSADEVSSGRLDNVDSGDLLSPGLWVLRLGTQSDSETASPPTFSQQALALLVYARLPVPVLAEPTHLSQAWNREQHPRVPGANLTTPNGGPISSSQNSHLGDVGLVVGVDAPGLGPATVNSPDHSVSTLEVYAPTSRHGVSVPFAVEPPAFELMERL